MIDREQVLKGIEEVLVPGVRRSVSSLNLVRHVEVSDRRVDISLASAALSPGSQEWLKAKVKEVVGKVPDVGEVNVEFAEIPPRELNEIGSVIAVMSGKGGVGKSLISSLAAVALARSGFDVGILDADITGPSIPKMFGIAERPEGGKTGLLPVLTHLGIEIMSVNLLLPHEDDAVIWRGPLIARAITQFWEDVLWGRLDYLIVDLPPGTADAPLTVLQSLPISGVIIVFSPQELAAMVVRKAIKMVREAMHIPILGVVENMSYFVVPETGKRIELFGKSRAEDMANLAGAPLLAQVPIDPQLARLCDEGEVERYQADFLQGFADAIARAVKTRAK